MLGQIANPQIADIAGALDARQAKLDRDEKRRREIRTAQLVAEAIPGLREGSPLKELAKNDVQTFAFLAKTLGVPLNSGDAIQSISDDVHSISKIAATDPQGAIQFADTLRKQRQQMGMDTKKLDEWVTLAQQDEGKAIRAMQVMDKSLNADLYRNQDIEQRKMALQERGLDLQEKRIDSELNAPQGQNIPASMQEIAYYNSLPDGAEKEAVGRKFGLVSKEGMDLSAYAEKQLDMASTEAAQASADAGRYMTLADQIKKSAMGSGLQSTWSEYIKEQTGNQDEITALRKQVMQIANSEAIKNLPPGPATDRDIEMVRAPFPTDKASPEYVANWLGAVARLNEKRAQFSEFKANFISKNNGLKTPSGESLISAWKNEQASQMQSAPPAATQGMAPPSATSQSGETAAQRLARLRGGN